MLSHYPVLQRRNLEILGLGFLEGARVEDIAGLALPLFIYR